MLYGGHAQKPSSPPPYCILIINRTMENKERKWSAYIVKAIRSKEMPHLVQTEMGTIFHGNQFLRGYLHNADRFFIEENEVV